MLNVDPRLQLPPPMTQALAESEAQIIDGMTKGMPGTALVRGQIGAQGWNILRGDVPLPLMLLKDDALSHNIALMQEYCNRHGAHLAPHGKTPMSPQVWARQLQEGAWGISLSTVQQLEVAATFGVPRVLLANQVVGAYELRRIADMLCTNPSLELLLVVDSIQGVERLRRALELVSLTHPLGVLVEYGMKGGRAGVRSAGALSQLAETVIGAGSNLKLAGVFGYEGLAPGSSFEERLDNVDTYLEDLREMTRTVRAIVPDQNEFLVSAGGSVYFDRVVAHLGKGQLSEAQLVLRPGAYVTHDSSFYERMSPLAKSNPRFLGGDALRPALEIWSHVLSRPEPDLVILGMGGRDAPSDLDLPLAYAFARDGLLRPLPAGHAISRMNDQHAFMRVPPSGPLTVGDSVICGVSHPCTSFDKWRQLFVVDDSYNILFAISTFF